MFTRFKCRALEHTLENLAAVNSRWCFVKLEDLSRDRGLQRKSRFTLTFL